MPLVPLQLLQLCLGMDIECQSLDHLRQCFRCIDLFLYLRQFPGFSLLLLPYRLLDLRENILRFAGEFTRLISFIAETSPVFP